MAFLNSVSTWLGGAILGAALLASPTQVAATVLSGMGPNTTPVVYADPNDPTNPSLNFSTPLVGLQSDASFGPLVETINILGPSILTSLTWWGYYLEPDPSFIPGTTADSFFLNGTDFSGLVDRYEAEVLDDGSGGTVQLYKYVLLSDPNAATFPGGTIDLELANLIFGAAWYWQGSAADPFGPRAYLVEGDLVRQEIPEPSSIALFGLALLALGASRARKLR